MDIFLNLPLHLALDIVRDWVFVDLRDLSALDVAHSNRGEFLDLLGQLPVTWDMSKSNMETISVTSKDATLALLHWMQSRSLQMSTLLVNCSHLVVGVIPVVEIATITRLILKTDNADIACNSCTILGKMFPAVASLDFSRWDALKEYTLLDFLPCPWKLQSLNICNTKISPVVLYTVLSSSLCSELKELWSDSRPLHRSPRLDYFSIWRLTDGRFNSLTKLALDLYDSGVDLRCLVGWCAMNTNLECLYLTFGTDFQPMALANAITNIAKRCAHLRTVELFGSNLTAAAFIAVVQHCLDLETLVFNNSIIAKFSNSSNGKRYWEFALDDDDFQLITGILQLIDNSTMTLRSVNSLSASVDLTTGYVELIANKFGPTLEELRCVLDEAEFEPPTLQYLFASCPQLQALHLQQCDVELLPREELTKLPEYCPRLRYLCLEGSYTAHPSYSCMTDAVIVDVLQGLSKYGCLEVLHLSDKRLTDIVLLTAVSCFPALKELGLRGTPLISAEVILSVIVEGKLKDAVICPATKANKTWICAQLRALGLGHLQCKLASDARMVM